MTTALYFGTPTAAVPALRTLHRIADVVGVVTQPDRPRGRSAKPVASPVKVTALELGLEVHQPATMADLAPVAASCDIGVLAAFGRLIPSSLLTGPRRGMVNVHFSLLPRWRGAAPVQHAILSGDYRTGITLIQMDEGLDTGPVLASCETMIGPDENAGDLGERLSVMGADLLAASFSGIVGGTLQAVGQDPALATEAPQVAPDDARLVSTATADEVLRLVRAFAPRPGAWGTVDGGRFKILEARVADAAIEPGEISGEGAKVLLGSATTAIELVTVQPQGKPAMAADAWFNGRRRSPARLR